MANAVILKEKGNYSKKHFGDFSKLKELKQKYKIDLATTYQTTYSFRAYADYRKFPEIKEKFDREHLKEQINKVRELFASCFEFIGKDNKFNEVIRLFNDRIKTNPK